MISCAISKMLNVRNIWNKHQTRVHGIETEGSGISKTLLLRVVDWSCPTSEGSLVIAHCLAVDRQSV